MASSAVQVFCGCPEGDRDARRRETVRQALRSHRITLRQVSERAGIPRQVLLVQLRGKAPLDLAFLSAAGELMIEVAQARMRSNRRLRAALAYHEAGHAVVGHALGRSVRRVSIVPCSPWGRHTGPVVFQGVSFGRVHFRRRGERGRWLRRGLPAGGPVAGAGGSQGDVHPWAVEDAAVCVAGAVAEWIYSGTPRDVSGWDLLAVCRMFDALWPDAGDLPEADWDRLWGGWLFEAMLHTISVADAHWPAIEGVAQALVIREELTGRQFARTIDPHFARLRAA